MRGLDPEAVSVFPAQDMKSVQPDAPWPEMPSFEETYAAARAAFPGVTLGGGMAAYFTELNRKRPPAGAARLRDPHHLPERACSR